MRAYSGIGRSWTLPLLLAVLWGCGEEKGVAPIGEEGPEAALLGTWVTEGVDEVLGPVRVHMRLEADGVLAMTLFLEGNGQRSFPGTWSLEEEELVLRGAYFGAAGERRVRWRWQGDNLVLEDSDGAVQVWTPD